jgi:hypothetical protein
MTRTFCPCSQPGASGFLIRWALASAAERVMVREVRRREPQQDQHGELAAPTRRQPLKHGDGSFTPRAFPGNTAVRAAGQRSKHSGTRRAVCEGGEESFLVAGDVPDRRGLLHQPVLQGRFAMGRKGGRVDGSVGGLLKLVMVPVSAGPNRRRLSSSRVRSDAGSYRGRRRGYWHGHGESQGRPCDRPG